MNKLTIDHLDDDQKRRFESYKEDNIEEGMALAFAFMWGKPCKGGHISCPETYIKNHPNAQFTLRRLLGNTDVDDLMSELATAMANF